MSFWRVYYHLVWATKDRKPLITSQIESQLYHYLKGKVVESKILLYAINGWTDHLHIVCSIPPKLAVAEAVKRLKGGSSHYVNHVIKPGYDFAWQRGYGVFTLGESQRAFAEAYVVNQKTHHAEQTTNGWLERVAEFDEGPSDNGLGANAGQTIVREPGAEYNAFGKPPF